MKLLFDFDNKSQIIIPAEEFAIVLDMDKNKTKIERIYQISVQHLLFNLRREALTST